MAKTNLIRTNLFSYLEIIRYKKETFCKLIPDAICFYAETGAIYGASKIKHIVDLN